MSLGANVELLTASPPAAAKLLFCAIASQGLQSAAPMPIGKRPLAQNSRNFAQFAPFEVSLYTKGAALSTVSPVTPPQSPPQGGALLHLVAFFEKKVAEARGGA